MDVVSSMLRELKVDELTPLSEVNFHFFLAKVARRLYVEREFTYVKVVQLLWKWDSQYQQNVSF